jgi:hypothetical protein
VSDSIGRAKPCRSPSRILLFHELAAGAGTDPYFNQTSHICSTNARKQYGLRLPRIARYKEVPPIQNIRCQSWLGGMLKSYSRKAA